MSNVIQTVALVFITLGEKANFFHDPYSGLTISKGEVIELKPGQKSKRVKAALAQGHLAYAENPNTNTAKQVDLVATLAKLEKLKSDPKMSDDNGFKIDAMAKKFSLAELEALAADAEIVIEEEDGKEDILNVLLN